MFPSFFWLNCEVGIQESLPLTTQNHIAQYRFLSPTGWVWQTPPLLLQSDRCPAALLQRGQPSFLSKRLGEVGPRNSPSLPSHARPPRWHTVWLATGRQGADWAGEAAGEASARGRRQSSGRQNRGSDIRRVFGTHTKESEGGVRCSYCCGAAAVWQESPTGEEGPQHSW